jgi:NADH-quinone oxidoreductase subunit J
LKENWLPLAPPLLGFAAIFLLLPRARRMAPIWGGLLAALALIAGAIILVRTQATTMEAILFYAFAGIAVAAGILMIAQSNPVHAALSFALVVLASCGLFLLQAAPFLMAATIIIYAGAIVVTFLFVIMLAQQEGISSADQRSREPFLASLAGGVLLAGLVCVLHRTYQDPEDGGLRAGLKALAEAKGADDVKQVMGDWNVLTDGERKSEFIERLQQRYPAKEIVDGSKDLERRWRGMRIDVRKNLPPLTIKAQAILDEIDKHRGRQGSAALAKVPGKDKTPGHFEPGKLPAGNVAALGKTLFTDYLIPVELAATLLLVATIGAIAIAGRRGGTEELR